MSVSKLICFDFVSLHKDPNMFLLVGGTCNISYNDSTHKELPVLLAKGLIL